MIAMTAITDLPLVAALQCSVNQAAGDVDLPVVPATLPAIVPAPFQHWVAGDNVPDDGAIDADAGPPDEAPIPAVTAQASEDNHALLGAMAPPLVPPPATPPVMTGAMPAARDAPTAPVVALASAPRPASVPTNAAPPMSANASASAGPGEAADTLPSPVSTVNIASPPAAVRSADSLVLAGPPAAWRQALHEALGERLQLQLGRNIEHATIRLDPPQLGRIDISVRHSGGNLEVHIAAANGEVLRQLNAVSDSLRSDLAGRQYSHVALSVGEIPRAQPMAQASGQPSDQGGAQERGRQHGQHEQRRPGLALDDMGEAGEPGAHFSMNART